MNNNCNNENNLKAVNEVYRNVKTALLSIDAVLHQIDSDDLRSEILLEAKGYEDFLSDLTDFMRSNEFEPIEVSPIKKTGMNIGIKMNTAINNGKSHVAEMMIKGSVTGYCELIRLINGNLICNENVLTFAKKLVALEEGYVEDLKKFL